MATIKEKIMAREFLSIEAFLPKYLNSIGKVTIPTIIKLDMKPPICMYPAPFCSRSAAVGKATNPGINDIDPIKIDADRPKKPDSSPIRAEIWVGDNKASMKPTRGNTRRNNLEGAT